MTICLGEHDPAEDRLAVNSGASKGQMGQWVCESMCVQRSEGAVCLLVKMLQSPDGTVDMRVWVSAWVRWSSRHMDTGAHQGQSVCV